MKLKDKNGITIEITNDEILAQISEKERFSLANKLLINK
jgi:dephospho-CoA kinase